MMGEEQASETDVSDSPRAMTSSTQYHKKICLRKPGQFTYFND
jgi:hypothetical protein